MPEPTLDSLLNFALDAAWQAWRVSLGYFQTSLDVERKADASPVTRADREAEERVRALIARFWPDHGVIGEEFGEQVAGSEYSWIIDPIDGTKSFISGVPLYACLIALISACQTAPDQIMPTLMDLPTATDSPTPVEKGRIEFWQPAQAEFSPHEMMHLWRFEAQAGDRITLRTVDAGVRTLLRILDPSGDMLADTTDEPISVSGEYTVQVIRLGDETGSYQLGLSYSNQANPNDATQTPLPVVVGVPTPLPVSADLGTFIDELASGETKGGTLTTPENEHVYIFRAVPVSYASIEVVRVNGELDLF